MHFSHSVAHVLYHMANLVVSGPERGSVSGLLVTQLFPLPRGSPKGRSPPLQSPYELGGGCPLPPQSLWGGFGSPKEHPFLFGRSCVVK